MFRRVLNAIHEGAGEEADLAAIEWRQGCGTWDVGVAMMKPEAYGGGVAAELGVAMGPALDEADEKRAHGRAVKEDEEGPELGGVEPVLEGVEVAFGGAGAGPFAASLAGNLVVWHWGLLCVCLSTDKRMGAASSAPTVMAGDHRGSPLRPGAASGAHTTGQGRALPLRVYGTRRWERGGRRKWRGGLRERKARAKLANAEQRC